MSTEWIIPWDELKVPPLHRETILPNQEDETTIRDGERRAKGGMKMDYGRPTCDTMASPQQKPVRNLKENLQATDGLLCELRLQLSEINRMVNGNGVEEKEGIEVVCMQDQAEVNRRLAETCLKEAIMIREGIMGK